MLNYNKIIDFKKYSSIGIGPKKEVLVINQIDNYDNYQIIGKASNLLISPFNKDKFAILGKNFKYIKLEGEFMYVGAATTSGELLRFVKENEISNFEFLAKIPGNIGGMIKMNAGLKEWEIFNQLDKIKTEKEYIKKENIKYSYRETNIDKIVYEAVFRIEKNGFNREKLEYFNIMRNNQPKGLSAGSCFVNPDNNWAAKLIENIGLKGYCKGDMSFSLKHANFLVNKKNGTFEEAIFLIELAKEKIKEKFNIELKEEIIVYK